MSLRQKILTVSFSGSIVSIQLSFGSFRKSRCPFQDTFPPLDEKKKICYQRLEIFYCFILQTIVSIYLSFGNSRKPSSLFQGNLLAYFMIYLHPQKKKKKFFRKKILNFDCFVLLISCFDLLIIWKPRSQFQNMLSPLEENKKIPFVVIYSPILVSSTLLIIFYFYRISPTKKVITLFLAQKQVVSLPRHCQIARVKHLVVGQFVFQWLKRTSDV